MEIGASETARRLNIPRGTVTKWASRYHWDLPTNKTGRPSYDVATLSPSPSEALAATLREHEQATRTSLAVAARNMAQEAETAGLAAAGKTLDATKVAQIVHQWGDQHQRNILNIGILANQVAIKADTE